MLVFHFVTGQPHSVQCTTLSNFKNSAYMITTYFLIFDRHRGS